MFQEKASGSKIEQPELNRLLEILREENTLMIWKIDGSGHLATRSFLDSLNQDCNSA
ncbi:recombinase family protein [Spirosoma koreense]